MVVNDGLITSLDVQLTDLSGRPAKSEHLHVDQDEALIFLIFVFHSYFYCLFCDGRNVRLGERQLFQLGEAQSENGLEHYRHMLK